MNGSLSSTLTYRNTSHTHKWRQQKKAITTFQNERAYFLANSFSRLDTSHHQFISVCSANIFDIRAHRALRMKMNFAEETYFIPSYFRWKMNEKKRNKTHAKQKNAENIFYAWTELYSNIAILNTSMMLLCIFPSTSSTFEHWKSTKTKNPPEKSATANKKTMYKQQVMWFPLSGSIFIFILHKDFVSATISPSFWAVKMPWI